MRNGGLLTSALLRASPGQTGPADALVTGTWLRASNELSVTSVHRRRTPHRKNDRGHMRPPRRWLQVGFSNCKQPSGGGDVKLSQSIWRNRLSTDQATANRSKCSDLLLQIGGGVIDSFSLSRQLISAAEGACHAFYLCSSRRCRSGFSLRFVAPWRRTTIIRDDHRYSFRRVQAGCARDVAGGSDRRTGCSGSHARSGQRPMVNALPGGIAVRLTIASASSWTLPLVQRRHPAVRPTWPCRPFGQDLDPFPMPCGSRLPALRAQRTIL